jgi:hypothetical protein
VAAAELRDFFWKIADSFRVFHWEALYRRRGGVSKWTRGAHPLVARPGGMGAPPPGVVSLWPPSGSPSVFVLRPGKI